MLSKEMGNHGMTGLKSRKIIKMTSEPMDYCEFGIANQAGWDLIIGKKI
jgi:hypothetical protein